MIFATVLSLLALTFPVASLARPKETTYIDTIEWYTLGARQLIRYLPEPPWEIPDRGRILCVKLNDGAHNLDVHAALLGLHARGEEPCRIDEDENTFNSTGRICKSLQIVDSAAMSICGSPGWGYTCGDAARIFDRVFLACRKFLNGTWRLSGQLVTDDGGWLTILPVGRV